MKRYDATALDSREPVLPISSYAFARMVRIDKEEVYRTPKLLSNLVIRLKCITRVLSASWRPNFSSRNPSALMRGEACLIRYADDFVCLFEYEEDAKAFCSSFAGTKLKPFKN